MRARAIRINDVCSTAWTVQNNTVNNSLHVVNLSEISFAIEDLNRDADSLLYRAGDKNRVGGWVNHSACSGNGLSISAL